MAAFIDHTHTHAQKPTAGKTTAATHHRHARRHQPYNTVGPTPYPIGHTPYNVAPLELESPPSPSYAPSAPSTTRPLDDTLRTPSYIEREQHRRRIRLTNLQKIHTQEKNLENPPYNKPPGVVAGWVNHASNTFNPFFAGNDTRHRITHAGINTWTATRTRTRTLTHWKMELEFTQWDSTDQHAHITVDENDLVQGENPTHLKTYTEHARALEMAARAMAPDGHFAKATPVMHIDKTDWNATPQEDRESIAKSWHVYVADPALAQHA